MVPPPSNGGKIVTIPRFFGEVFDSTGKDTSELHTHPRRATVMTFTTSAAQNEARKFRHYQATILPMSGLYAGLVLVNGLLVLLVQENWSGFLLIALAAFLLTLPAVLLYANQTRLSVFLFVYSFYFITFYLSVLSGADSNVHFTMLILPPFAWASDRGAMSQVIFWILGGVGFVACLLVHYFYPPVVQLPFPETMGWINSAGTLLAMYYAFFILRNNVERTTRALVASRDHYRSVIDGAMDAIISVDHEHRIVDWNPQATRIFGFTTPEMLGEVWYHHLIVEKFREPFEFLFQQLELTGETPFFNRRQEVPLRRKNGTMVVCEAAIIPVELNGKLTYHAYVRDVTDRNRTRRKLLATNQELQQFASVASHDMKEPLRTISNFSGLLRSRMRDDKDGSELLGFVEDAAKRMTKLLEDLIKYARSGRPTEELYPVDLGKVCGAVEKNLLHLLVRSQGEIRCHDLPSLLGTETLYTQLLQNLVSNGIKYQLPGNPPRIDVSCTPVRGGYHLCVTDNGIGMDAEQSRQIFQPFRRLHSRADYDGSGIGLATCKKIVDALDGTIEVISTPGTGSTFTVFLPERLAMKTSEPEVVKDTVSV